MFTSSRARRHQQQMQQQQGSMSPPPDGSDSFYGVRSLEGSVCNDLTVPHSTSQASQEDFAPIRDASPVAIPEALSDHTITPTTDHPSLPDSTPVSTDSPSASFVPHSSEIIPPSPDDTLHPLDRLETVRERSSDRRAELQRRLSLADLPTVPSFTQTTALRSDPHTPISAYYDNHSVPSSPASMSFSFSSLSRTSSPVSGIGYRRRSQSAIGLGLGGADDLVLPKLDLPSSSLHMSLPKLEAKQVEDRDGALKIGLLGGSGETGEMIRALADVPGVQLVDVGNAVGVIRGTTLVAELVTSRTIEQVQRTVFDCYSAFDTLLNPDLPSDKSEAIRKMAGDYARRNDWTHLCLVLNDDDRSAPLARLVPAITASVRSSALTQLDQANSEHANSDLPPNESRVPTPSPPRLGDEATPMPSVSAAASYFAPSHATIEEDAEAALSTTDRAVQLLLEAVAHPDVVTSASFTKFIEWRHNDNAPTPLHSSATMSTTPSTSSYNTPPMPTVAATHGRREWNANLSRRLAATHDAHKQRKGRRSSRGERDNHREKAKRLERERGCGPLFPRGSGRAGKSWNAGTAGLGGLWEGIFGKGSADGIKVFGLSWKWGLTVAAAAVLVVGWGCWARAR